MSNTFMTPNMNMPSPVPGAEPGPQWATDNYNCLSIIDGHTHAPGSGVQITPTGLNINAALPFNSNQATDLAFVSFTAQGGSVPVPTNGSVYVSGVDLFYKDISGNAVQITSGGAVNATSSGISSGTASASFVSSVLVVTESTGVGAAIDAASYILRYNGSYPAPSGNAIVLAAPAALATSYQLTFPATTPGASGAFLTSSTAGALSYTNVDNSTLQISGSTLQVKSGGITTSQIAAATITGSNIAAATISGSNIGAGTITASNISNATLTGTQLVSNINLPGNTVQENGRNVVVSNTNTSSSLAIVRGRVTITGGIAAGEGFSVSHTVTGGYVITFTTAFVSAPVITATAETVSANTISIVIAALSTSSVTIDTYNAGSASDQAFHFIAIGPRT